MTTAQIELPLEVEYLCNNTVQFRSEIELHFLSAVSVMSWTIHPEVDFVEAGRWYRFSFRPFEGEDSIHSIAFSSHDPSGTYVYTLPIRECEEEEDDDTNPYGYWGLECGGDGLLLMDFADQTVYIDGNPYHVNGDGSFSWVVPEGMAWVWEVYDARNNGNLLVTITSDGENCLWN